MKIVITKTAAEPPLNLAPRWPLTARFLVASFSVQGLT